MTKISIQLIHKKQAETVKGVRGILSGNNKAKADGKLIVISNGKASEVK